MTETLAMHLIEQFAAQAPFAIWITDSRGIAIFANKKLHDLLKAPSHPSGALGVNVFEEPAVAALGLTDAAERLRRGEVIDLVVDIPEPQKFETAITGGRKEPLTLRITAYTLRSSTQKIEHYVIILDDVTENHAVQRKLREQMRNIAIYTNSKTARIDKLRELEQEIADLEKRIRDLGAEPVN